MGVDESFGHLLAVALSDIDKDAVNPPFPDNLLLLHPRRPPATHCQDCDPEGVRPFRVEVRADSRTGDILTPCPVCGRHALARVGRTAGRRGLSA